MSDHVIGMVNTAAASECYGYVVVPTSKIVPSIITLVPRFIATSHTRVDGTAYKLWKRRRRGEDNGIAQLP
jgi:hypothetical protein